MVEFQIGDRIWARFFIIADPWAATVIRTRNNGKMILARLDDDVQERWFEISHCDPISVVDQLADLSRD